MGYEYRLDGEKLTMLIKLHAANKGMKPHEVRAELRSVFRNKWGKGISKQMLSYLEHGASETSLSNVVLLCNFFGLKDINYIVKKGGKK